MPAERGQGSTRKPINPGLPEAVRQLLREMEELADDTGISFPKVVEQMSRAGPRLHRTDVTRWREGKSLPREGDVRRWAEVCHGDVDHLVTLHAQAAPAFKDWKRDADRRRRSSGQSPAAADAEAPEYAATRSATGADDLLRRARWRVPVIVGVIAVVAAGGTAVWFGVISDDEPQPPSPAIFRTESCTWPQGPMPSITWAGSSEPQRQVPLMYKVPSGAGSTDVAVEAGGSVSQPFVATAPRIDQVAAIIGIDPERADVRAVHPVRFEVIEPGRDGTPPRLLGEGLAEVTPDNANKDIVATVDLPVTPGRLYVLRVINEADADPIGIYVNRPRGKDRRVVHGADVCVVGAIIPFTPAGWVLAGFVSATS